MSEYVRPKPFARGDRVKVTQPGRFYALRGRIAATYPVTEQNGYWVYEVAMWDGDEVERWFDHNDLQPYRKLDEVGA